jgi:zinc finger protein DZIP1
MNVDLDRVVKEIDLSTLETLLSNITFANLERDDIERLGDAHFVKLFRVAQMTIEYLLYTQDYF